ncbi:MAG: radical SAM family heme chaperone HemW [Lachnospiraceae bacterium]|nr:radical SAM family heme chaperone HemW [Lachnospiraceae bacterium]
MTDKEMNLSVNRVDKYSEIYVHVPFCVKKCDYCDFVSFARSEDTHKAYFEALNKQIDYKAEFTGKIPVDSVFFGGGTPSLVSAEYIVSTLNHLRERYDITDDAEITIEMNPNSASKEKIEMYKKAGINRISIGLQSTENSELKCLARPHNFEDFLETYKAVRDAGFDNINVDIMSALPGQNLESYKKTLKKVVELNPEHISAYSLIIEEGTPFYDLYGDGEMAGCGLNEVLPLPGEDEEREMYYETKRFLAKNGYERYEISNYSKPGLECKHNIGYWTGKDYIGFGIAAASLKDGIRYQMHSDLDEYIRGNFDEEREILTENDRMSEFMFLGLRMVNGIERTEFKRRFNVEPEKIFGKQLADLVERKLLVKRGDYYALTEYGLDVSNVCMAEFLLD